MAEGYNYIFDQLVQEEGDFVGMVAYTIYKRQKVEWLKNFEKDNGRQATDAEVEASFSKFSNLPSQLAAYREQALDLIDNFLDFALAEKVEEAREEIRNDAIVAAVTRPFSSLVVENLVAGLAASLITLGAAGLFWVAAKGPENLVREALQNLMAESKEPAPQAE